MTGIPIPRPWRRCVSVSDSTGIAAKLSALDLEADEIHFD